MTKRDSLLAGFTYPSSSMSMPRRHSWRSRSHGYPSSTAAPSDPFTSSRRATDPSASDAGPSLLPAESSDHISHYGYSTADTATPIPAPADHQTPILPRLEEEAYPLQMELAETRRQLHAYYFVEVQTPQADNSQPALRRLMVTEVDRRGVHRNRQPEFFFNGIIGHIRAGRNVGINPPNLPTTGDGISKFQKYPRMAIGIHITMKLRKAQYPYKDPAWMIQTPLPPMLTLLRHLSRFNDWQPSSGTFSTMTEMPTWQYSNDSRIQMMT